MSDCRGAFPSGKVPALRKFDIRNVMCILEPTTWSPVGQIRQAPHPGCYGIGHVTWRHYYHHRCLIPRLDFGLLDTGRVWAWRPCWSIHRDHGWPPVLLGGLQPTSSTECCI